MKKLIFIELNEVRFNSLEGYIKQGHLPSFKKLIDDHGYCRTESETKYENLEPWIQWVSARTGKSYEEHGIFRLGDIIESDIPQYWETVESLGYSVAAISPINGANHTKNSPFWIPDPWVNTKVSGNWEAKAAYKSIRQAVNENAKSRLSARSVVTLLYLIAKTITARSFSTYKSNAVGIWKRKKWHKAVLLDQLLCDLFMSLWEKHKPDCSTLFLNSAAHLQHHYFYNSETYEGDTRNPDWYIDPKDDPLLRIYEVYDSLIERLQKTGNTRILIGTGLSQIPYDRVTFYYRLREHLHFLSLIDIFPSSLETRMSRDFLISFDNEESCSDAEEKLVELSDNNKRSIFTCDNRGCSLFVTLEYPYEIGTDFDLLNGEGKCSLTNFLEHVAFVAIKNGHHCSEGYFIDTENYGAKDDFLSIQDLHDKVIDHFQQAKRVR